MNTSITEKIRSAVIYCAMIHGTDEDVRNDAANIYADEFIEYLEITKALEFNN